MQACGSASRSGGVGTFGGTALALPPGMLDLVFSGSTVVFFLISFAYVLACERM